MTTLRTRTAVAALLALAAPALRAQGRTAALRAAIEQRIALDSGVTVGVYFADLTVPDSVALNADLRFHAASTMKVAVMVQVWREIDAGRLRPEQQLPVHNAFRSLVGDTAYALSADDDSERSLYGRVGRQASVEELVELMITRSSNLATNVLLAHVGAPAIQATLAELGLDSLSVLRGVEDGPAFRAGRNNTTTARALGQLFAALADGRAASPIACGAMLAVLQRQQFRDAIPAGLPRRTRVAHKTGTITALHHDAGLVYVRNRPRYVIAVLTRGIAQPERSALLIADIARLVHQHVVPPPPPREPPRP